MRQEADYSADWLSLMRNVYIQQLPQCEWSVKGPQTIERTPRVYKPTQNTICGALSISLLLSCVCKGRTVQLHNLHSTAKPTGILLQLKGPSLK